MERRQPELCCLFLTLANYNHCQWLELDYLLKLSLRHRGDVLQVSEFGQVFMNTPAKGIGRARILLADDHTLVAEACKRLLEPEFEVVGIVGDGRALLRANALLKPDVIVSDVAMPCLNGLDACAQAKEVRPDVRIIHLTMMQDPELAAEAFRQGASGYLLKTSAAPELLIAVREALNGRLYISPQITRTTVSEFVAKYPAHTDRHKLTARQRQVLQLLAEGRAMKEAADILNVKMRTIAFHKYRIMDTLNVHTNAELVQYALRNFLISR
jgi:DNA-binding NarL/FixJ family response regulator